MKLDRISTLPREDLFSLITICRRDTRFFDGYWFINVEKRFGFEEALDIHVRMWEQFGEYQAGLIVKAFALGDHPVERLTRAIELDPAWLFWGYRIDRLSETAAAFRVSDCVAQRARIKSGKGLNPDCERVDGGYLGSFARVIHPGIRVTCSFGPQCKERGDLWCEWLFSFPDSTGTWSQAGVGAEEGR